MLRLLLAAALALVPVAVVAAPSPSPLPASPAAEPKDGGVINGQVTAVDYQRSVIGIDTVNRGHLDVYVMPTTSIQGRDNAYHTLIDVKTGARVQVFSSIADGKYVAQIILLR